MQHKEVDCATIGAASSAGISGRVTAGGAFGIAIAQQTDDKTRLAAVNHDDNTIIVLGPNTEEFQDQ